MLASLLKIHVIISCVSFTNCLFPSDDCEFDFLRSNSAKKLHRVFPFFLYSLSPTREHLAMPWDIFTAIFTLVLLACSRWRPSTLLSILKHQRPSSHKDDLVPNVSESRLIVLPVNKTSAPSVFFLNPNPAMKPTASSGQHKWTRLNSVLCSQRSFSRRFIFHCGISQGTKLC